MPKRKNHRSWIKKVAIIAAILLILFSFESMLLMLRFNRIHRFEPEVISTSFSPVQAERFGSNWQDNYVALMDEQGFKHIRIPAYWDKLEPQDGQFDFSQTDWMVDQAAQRGVKLTLVVGQKNIRYPECYYPWWLNTKDKSETSQKAVRMVQAVAEHYKDNQTIEKWQLENEFLLKSFGNCPKDQLTNVQLRKELAALKQVDNTRPIELTQSDQFGFPLRGPFANIFGVSMYRWSWNKGYGYWRYPQPGAYFWFKAALIEPLFHQRVQIHELQAEAWGPVGNEYMDFEDTLKTMNPQQLKENIQYARDTKIRDFSLWGSEWWWHLKQTGHPEMWDAVKQLNKD